MFNRISALIVGVGLLMASATVGQEPSELDLVWSSTLYRTSATPLRHVENGYEYVFGCSSLDNSRFVHQKLEQWLQTVDSGSPDRELWDDFYRNLTARFRTRACTQLIKLWPGLGYEVGTFSIRARIKADPQWIRVGKPLGSDEVRAVWTRMGWIEGVR